MSQDIDKNGRDEPQSHLDRHELALWQALKKISATTASVMRGEIGPGVSGADFSVLSRIEELGEQGQVLAQSDLMKSLGWDKSRLSHQLTRMQERGLIERRRNGREAEVVLREAGRALLASARPKQVAIVKNYLSQLTEAEAEAMEALAAKL
ncbi:MarR family winged helix-turn-helix transcriptional regulator [Rhizobium sp. WYJ-E13]|uniref:MarR family winged helix-turn-helix transcriptional regulator n=1 Tax=Rhizobium sp. WYJ-E13 TaxID=2849093 RepID=UPI001C1EE2E7|nr:MarR family transcriptional regulator [Rhizobium sp. WYJ-E13]QWW72347.1 MarR family transcriptional regulator [Rhizobium sp. WYJ-E13]